MQRPRPPHSDLPSVTFLSLHTVTLCGLFDIYDCIGRKVTLL